MRSWYFFPETQELQLINVTKSNNKTVDGHLLFDTQPHDIDAPANDIDRLVETTTSLEYSLSGIDQ